MQADFRTRRTHDQERLRAPASRIDFPVGAQSREVGARAALASEAGRLGLVGLIDEAVADKARRSDPAVSFGELLVTKRSLDSAVTTYGIWRPGSWRAQ